jgi:hypothetical protein
MTTVIPPGCVRPSLNKKKATYITTNTTLPPHLNPSIKNKMPKCAVDKNTINIYGGFFTVDPHYNVDPHPTTKKKGSTPKIPTHNKSKDASLLKEESDYDSGETMNVVDPILPRCSFSPRIADSTEILEIPLTPGMKRPRLTPKNIDHCRTPSWATSPRTIEEVRGVSPGMKVPRCARTPGVKDEYNPWIPETTEGAREVKILARTPIGTIARVPTCDYHPVYIPKPVEVANNESILNASIYLDLSDRDYHYVSNKMRTLNENTKNLQKQYSNVLQPYPTITNPLNPDKFEELLLVYENNQVYYQDLLEGPNPQIPEITNKLKELEQWFIGFAEPRPHDKLDFEDWQERELFRKTHKISQYCDPALYKYLLSPKHPLLIVKDD